MFVHEDIRGQGAHSVRLVVEASGDEHYGFFNAFESVSKVVEAALGQIGNLPTYVTGHSLGGALAKVAILEISAPNWVACYTFGSPAICDKKRCSLNKVPVFLVVDAGDVVPRILSLSPALATLVLWIMQFIGWVFSRFGKKLSLWDLWIARFSALIPDLGKYEQFGSVEFIDEDGEIVALKNAPDVLSVFWRIFSKNWRRSYEDHSISLYIDRLTAFASIKSRPL